MAAGIQGTQATFIANAKKVGFTNERAAELYTAGNAAPVVTDAATLKAKAVKYGHYNERVDHLVGAGVVIAAS